MRVPDGHQDRQVREIYLLQQIPRVQNDKGPEHRHSVPRRRGGPGREEDEKRQAVLQLRQLSQLQIRYVVQASGQTLSQMRRAGPYRKEDQKGRGPGMPEKRVRV